MSKQRVAWIQREAEAQRIKKEATEKHLTEQMVMELANRALNHDQHLPRHLGGSSLELLIWLEDYCMNLWRRRPEFRGPLKALLKIVRKTITLHHQQ